MPTTVRKQACASNKNSIPPKRYKNFVKTAENDVKTTENDARTAENVRTENVVRTSENDVKTTGNDAWTTENMVSNMEKNIKTAENYVNINEKTM